MAKIRRVKRTFRAAIVIGNRGKDGLPKIETYLLGFTGVLYGKKITLSFRKRIRDFMSYRDEDVLKRQIAKDIRRVERLISLTE